MRTQSITEPVGLPVALPGDGVSARLRLEEAVGVMEVGVRDDVRVGVASRDLRVTRGSVGTTGNARQWPIPRRVVTQTQVSEQCPETGGVACRIPLCQCVHLVPVGMSYATGTNSLSKPLGGSPKPPIPCNRPQHDTAVNFCTSAPRFYAGKNGSTGYIVGSSEAHPLTCGCSQPLTAPLPDALTVHLAPLKCLPLCTLAQTFGGACVLICPSRIPKMSPPLRCVCVCVCVRV